MISLEVREKRGSRAAVFSETEKTGLIEDHIHGVGNWRDTAFKYK